MNASAKAEHLAPGPGPPAETAAHQQEERAADQGKQSATEQNGQDALKPGKHQSNDAHQDQNPTEDQQQDAREGWKRRQRIAMSRHGLSIKPRFSGMIERRTAEKIWFGEP